MPVTPLNDRVMIGCAWNGQLQNTACARIGIAGGRRKLHAIREARAGRWINVLITDRHIAEVLVEGGSFRARYPIATDGQDTTGP